MSEAAVEAIVLAINALGCGILLVVAGVVQKMMNEMECLGSTRCSKTLSGAVLTL
jgi:hypothetical protein